MYCKLLILVNFFLIPVFCISQVLDSNVSMEKKDIYNYLLKEQINYLVKIKEHTTYKDDTTLFVRYNPFFTSYLSDSINNRKIAVINNIQIDSLLNIRELSVVEIFPFYIKEGNIYLECAYYSVSINKQSLFFAGGSDGTRLIIKYNCNSEKYELIGKMHP